MELPPGDVLPRPDDHRIALDGPGATLLRGVDRRAREGVADPAPPEARASEKAGHRPDAGVALVLRPTRPRHAIGAQQSDVGGARLDCAPAHRLAVEIGDEAAGRRRVRVTAR